MDSKRLSFAVIASILVLISHNNDLAMSDSSKLKVIAGTIVSGALGGGIATLLTRQEGLKLGVDFHYKWFNLDLGYWSLNRKIVCAAATTISALIGTYISYYYLTPEGQLLTLEKKLKSIDQSLLEIIKSCQNFEQFSKKIQFYYKKYTVFPTIMAFENLEMNRGILIDVKIELEKLLSSAYDYPHLEDRIRDILNSVALYMPITEKGIEIIRSDKAFEAKWQGYMLEKRLAEIKQELCRMKWQLACSVSQNRMYY